MKVKDTLKTFFTISVGAFEFQDKITLAITGIQPRPSGMRLLHEAALHELQSEVPDLKLIDSLLEQMEHLAEANKKAETKTEEK